MSLFAVAVAVVVEPGPFASSEGALPSDLLDTACQRLGCAEELDRLRG